MELNTIDNKKLLEDFAKSFGRAAFDKEPQLHRQVEDMKNEILKRMQSNIITTTDLKYSLADEYVIIGNENVESIFTALKNKLNIVTPITKKKSATIISIIDSSGSMGSFEKYLSQCVSLWTEKLIELKYEKVNHRFISHHTEAQEVHRDVFFVKGESGGTIISSGLNKANERINYIDYENQDIYVFQYSDGDNLTSDNDVSVRVLKDILNKVNQFEYVEINQYSRSSTIMSAYRNVQNSKFNAHVLREKNDVLKTVESISSAIMF
ncbi:DUF444 family protein [Paenibacillus cremeus]|uniref:DUF444 family protein n=1 Tax=Paenibacillus cremeus TaxID=2163881 RepID=A0A559KCL9_9BACL|nr:DUF444 family protein [Paenibacillus cremeus]TVY09871.1 DUF444 family protein [Paenibacillus cremeus]